MIRPEFLTRQINEVVRDLSAIGSFTVLLAVNLVFLYFDFRFGVAMLAGLAVVEFLGAVLKVGAHRTRPDGQAFTNLLEKADAGSFPSVHTARAATVAALLHTRFPQLFWLIPFTLTLIFLVALSRILLKRHYISDVAGGLVLGLLTGLGLAALFFR